ncbi:Cytochrome c-type bioproteinis protein CycH [Alteripontixanthobacter maritimus]|uniref:Cytochrome c-type bioproteinis protein CycH n=1 Tax=Alteripontixanthobacter maritimus TaxID=2161824 RepID=A0A369Q612_9SPHN|nr:cytochrome c biogenesis factor [Alteripontixanthobacter maritimus]RDC60323.1 Cytochrome c-type bioproteinis protein CycH [Alteripontixanthobacter maritimus]
MIWLPLILLLVVTMAGAILLLRLPKAVWTIFAAALVFGLAGYAWQGQPGRAGAPAQQDLAAPVDGEGMVAARRAMFSRGATPSRNIILSDGFARRGQYETAAGLLRREVRERPGNTEAWLALANALVGHADGQITPAARHAFARAEASDPAHPGAAYFAGVALIRKGDPAAARQLWADLLETAPADAEWRGELLQRLARLDALIAFTQAPTQGDSPATRP